MNFSVENVTAVKFAAAPLLHFKLRIATGDASTEIQNILLRCQIQIETVKRRYDADEKSRLFELYGEPDRWGQTLKPMLWTHASTTVGPFAGETVVDLPVACTFDFNVASTKYFDALREGDIPLCLLFSGTIFYRDDTGALQVRQIPWEKEASYRLPVSSWRQMMDHYYPNKAWLTVSKDVFDRLQAYKAQNAIPSWEKVFERLLSGVKKEVATKGTAVAGSG